MERIRFSEEKDIFVALQPERNRIRLLLQQEDHDIIVNLSLLQFKVLADSLNALLYYQMNNCAIDEQHGLKTGAMTIISVFTKEVEKSSCNEYQQLPSSDQFDKPFRFKSA